MDSKELRLYISMYVPYGAEICLAKDHSIRDNFRYEHVESVVAKEWLLVLKPNPYYTSFDGLDINFRQIIRIMTEHLDIFNLIPAGYAIGNE